MRRLMAMAVLVWTFGFAALVTMDVEALPPLVPDVLRSDFSCSLTWQAGHDASDSVVTIGDELYVTVTWANAYYWNPDVMPGPSAAPIYYSLVLSYEISDGVWWTESVYDSPVIIGDLSGGTQNKHITAIHDSLAPFCMNARIGLVLWIAKGADNNDPPHFIWDEGHTPASLLFVVSGNY